MHWILQQNMLAGRGNEELVDVLRRASIPHSLHRVVPFVGEEDGLRVIETNTMNAAGFYAADIPRKLEALEAMRVV